LGEGSPVSNDRPLVTVISPTFGSPHLLRTRCIPSVEAQTYPNIEHLIVVNGGNQPPEENTPTRRIVHLGRDWNAFAPGTNGIIPVIAGSTLARGKYIAYLDYDDEFQPQHVEKLVDLLESSGADWVYSQMAIIRQGKFWGQVIGGPKPAFGEISGQLLLHKAEMFNVANWDPKCEDNKACLPQKWRKFAVYAADWDLIHRWVKSSAKWAHLPEVTVMHHRDSSAELEEWKAFLASGQYATKAG